MNIYQRLIIIDMLFVLNQAYFYEFKPVFVISSLLSSFVASKLNLNWGNPFFWLFDRVHEIIDEKVKENKMGLKVIINSKNQQQQK